MPDQPHIAFVRQRYDAHGGAERQLTLIIEAIQKGLNAKVTLITREWTFKKEANISIIKCDPFYIGRLWRDWSFYIQACKIIKRNHFDLVQSHERLTCGDIYRAGDGLHASWLEQRKRVKSYWQKLAIRLSPYHNFILFQEKMIFKNPRLRAIVANSEQVAADIGCKYPWKKSVIHIIQNACDLTKFSHELRKKHFNAVRQQLNIPIQAKLGIFVGSGFERKGVSQLLDIFSQLPEKYRLLIIGRNKRNDFYIKKCQKLGLQNRVHFMGPQENITPFIGCADFFLFPSLYDPMPNAAIEAIASNLPVIASNKTGASEITKEIGLTAPDPLDTASWVQEILKLESMRPIEHISLDKYSTDTMLSSYTGLYIKLLRK